MVASAGGPARPASQVEASSPAVAAPFIIEGTAVATARAAVDGVQGRILSEIPLIDSVTAMLTPSQTERLRKHPLVRAIFPDATVKVASATIDTSATSTVADRFENVSYSNNDGSNRWSTDWIETGDDGQPRTGAVLGHLPARRDEPVGARRVGPGWRVPVAQHVRAAVQRVEGVRVCGGERAQLQPGGLQDGGGQGHPGMVPCREHSRTTDIGWGVRT